jgi:ferric-dicitrate binding protein FerR (iron transport regulator)
MILVLSLVALTVLAALVKAWSQRQPQYDDEALRRLLTTLVATHESGWIAAAQKVAEQKVRGPFQWRAEVHIMLIRLTHPNTRGCG